CTRCHNSSGPAAGRWSVTPSSPSPESSGGGSPTTRRSPRRPRIWPPTLPASWPTPWGQPYGPASAAGACAAPSRPRSPTRRGAAAAGAGARGVLRDNVEHAADDAAAAVAYVGRASFRDGVLERLDELVEDPGDVGYQAFRAALSAAWNLVTPAAGTLADVIEN